MDLIEIQTVVNTYFADRKKVFACLGITYRIVHGDDLYVYITVRGTKREIRNCFPAGTLHIYVIEILKSSILKLVEGII